MSKMIIAMFFLSLEKQSNSSSFSTEVCFSIFTCGEGIDGLGADGEEPVDPVPVGHTTISICNVESIAASCKAVAWRIIFDIDVFGPPWRVIPDVRLYEGDNVFPWLSTNSMVIGFSTVELPVTVTESMIVGWEYSEGISNLPVYFPMEMS